MADSVYMQILEAVQSELKTLALSGITDQDIILLKVLTDRDSMLPTLPGIIIAPFGAQTSNATSGTNIRDEIGYPVAVVTLQKGNQDQLANFDRSLNWNRLIRRHFIHQRLTGVIEVNRTTVEPKDAFDPGAWKNLNLDVNATVYRFWTWETRG